jgi:addiction module HigA family antidote
MTISHKVIYAPEYAIPPGETLLETLQSVGMTQADLAERTGRPLKTINEIVKGKAAITPETALQFEKVLRIPASFWNALETNYQQALAKCHDREKLKKFVTWLNDLPIKELTERGWLKATADKSELVEQALAFFGVSDPTVWRQMWLSPRATFHRSTAFKMSPGAMAAWLRIGEIKAQKVRCKRFDRSAFRTELQSLRSLTTVPPAKIKAELVERSRQLGVAVVFVAELSGTHVSGATQWLTAEKALIQLSCRYKSDDQFWHAFFHECGHIVLHGKRDVFIDDSGTKRSDKQENEANDFAAELLIPRQKMRHFFRRWPGDDKSIVDFAAELGIAPGIIVGQLQHMGDLSFSQFNHLKRYQFDLTDDN